MTDNRTPDIKTHVAILQACEQLSGMLQNSCQDSAALIVRQNNSDMEIIVASTPHEKPIATGSKFPNKSNFYCHQVVTQQQPLQLNDASQDNKWQDNPLFEMGYVSYYGVPVNWPDGTSFGTVCLLHSQPREFPENERKGVSGAAQVIEILLEQIITSENYRLLASHDQLTGFLNRSATLERAQQELDRSHRYNSLLSIIYFDIDQMNQLNDQYGHLAGDLVIEHFAKLLKSQSRTADILGRLAGEEFALFAVETPLEEAQQLAERILHSMSDTPTRVGTTEVPATVCAGVTSLRPEDTSVDNMLSRVSNALSKAKSQGCNQVEKI